MPPVQESSTQSSHTDNIHSVAIDKQNKPKKGLDTFYYPPDIANDLEGLGLSQEFKAECFACAWEYVRCIIPRFTNWERYIAFVKICVIATVVEVRGDLVDLVSESEYV
jgi:hypothetical protein